MLKNVRWSPLNTKMAKTVTLGSANPLTVTNLGGGSKIAFIYLEDGMDKNCSKNVRWGPLNAKMTKTATLGSANPLTVTNLGGGGGTKTDLFTWNRATVKIVKKHSCS